VRLLPASAHEVGRELGLWPVLAQSGRTVMICFLSAFGAEQTSGKVAGRVGVTRLTRSRHRGTENSAMQWSSLAPLRAIVLAGRTL